MFAIYEILFFLKIKKNTVHKAKIDAPITETVTYLGVQFVRCFFLF